MRLGFCYYEPREIEEGIKRLKACVGSKPV